MRRGILSSVAPLALLLATGAGCPADLSRFGGHGGGDDDGQRDAAPGDDLAATQQDDAAMQHDAAAMQHDGPSAPRDLATTSHADLATVATTCALPQLLVAVEDTTGVDFGGKVLRWSLLPDGTSVRCSDLGGQQIPSTPLAVAWLPPATVGVATIDGPAWINVGNNTLGGTYSPPNSTSAIPIDAVGLVDPSTGHATLAVSYTFNGISCAGEVDLVDTVADTAKVWQTSGTTSCAISMSPDPFSTGKLLVLDPDANDAAIEIDPFGNVKGAVYLATNSSLELETIYAFQQPATSNPPLYRVAWVNHTLAGDNVRYSNQGTNQPGFSNASCPSAGNVSFVHVVPDPHPDFYSFFALTEGATVNGRDILHFSSQGTCDTLFTGSSLPTGQRPTHLAVALP